MATFFGTVTTRGNIVLESDSQLTAESGGGGINFGAASGDFTTSTGTVTLAGDTIVAEGHTLSVPTPTEPEHAANASYVTAACADIVATSGTTFALACEMNWDAATFTTYLATIADLSNFTSIRADAINTSISSALSYIIIEEGSFLDAQANLVFAFSETPSTYSRTILNFRADVGGRGAVNINNNEPLNQVLSGNMALMIGTKLVYSSPRATFAAGVVSTWNLHCGGAALVSTTGSTSTSTGALVVAGGMGVAGDVHIGGRLSTNFQYENLIPVAGVMTSSNTQFMTRISNQGTASDVGSYTLNAELAGFRVILNVIESAVQIYDTITKSTQPIPGHTTHFYMYSTVMCSGLTGVVGTDAGVLWQ